MQPLSYRARHLFTRSAHLKLISLVAAIGPLSLGCDLGPDRPTSTGPIVKYTVSGTVSEVGPTGLAPLSGAEVREEWSRVQAITDSNGFYMLSGVYGATASVKVTRNGYVPATKTLAAEVDAQLNFEVNRIVTYVLSGVAFEMVRGRRLPLEAVELYCEACGSPDGHTYAYTDASGFYSFSWVLGPTRLEVAKPGYRLAVDSRGDSTTSVTVSSDTRVDVELVRE